MNCDMHKWDIDWAVKSGFAKTAYAGGDSQKMDGWRALGRISQGHGNREVLRPMQGGVGGELTYHDLYL